MDDFLFFNFPPMHSANDVGDRAGRLQKIQDPGLTSGVIDIALLRSEMQIAALYLRILIQNATMFPAVKKCAILPHRKVGSTARLCRPRSSGDRATVS